MHQQIPVQLLIGNVDGRVLYIEEWLMKYAVVHYRRVPNGIL